jgi:hypothetical protein
MARKEVVELIDDLDGRQIQQGEGQTIRFALDGRALEIDLNNKNAEKLRTTLAPYIAAARKSGSKPTAGRRKADGVTRLYDPKIVRRWAEANNVELPKRRRIPQRIIEQFEAREGANGAGHSDP